MKTVSLFILFLILVIITGCSKDSDDQKGHKGVKKAPVPVAPVITKLTFENSTPSAGDFIRVIPEVDKQRYPNGYQYICRWFVNDKAVGQKPSIQLKRGTYKRGDSVFCKLKVVSDKSKLESEEFESKSITVKNSSPETMTQEENISFRPPGDFRYRIVAKDPDGDKLSYRLIGPLDRNIKINQESGELSFRLNSIDDKPLKIIVDISDNNGGSAIFTLNLQKQTGSQSFGEDPQ